MIIWNACFVQFDSGLHGRIDSVVIYFNKRLVLIMREMVDRAGEWCWVTVWGRCLFCGGRLTVEVLTIGFKYFLSDFEVSFLRVTEPELSANFNSLFKD